MQSAGTKIFKMEIMQKKKTIGIKSSSKLQTNTHDPKNNKKLTALERRQSDTYSFIFITSFSKVETKAKTARSKSFSFPSLKINYYLKNYAIHYQNPNSAEFPSPAV